MALTIREKKLAVMWLAEEKVVDAMVKLFANDVADITAVFVARRTKLQTQVFSSFTASELEEFRNLAAQLPDY